MAKHLKDLRPFKNYLYFLQFKWYLDDQKHPLNNKNECLSMYLFVSELSYIAGSSLLCGHTWSGWAGSLDVLMFSISSYCRFSKVVVPVQTPLANVESIISLLNHSHPTGCTLVSLFGFNFYFSSDWWFWTICHTLLPLACPFFFRMSFPCGYVRVV